MILGVTLDGQPILYPTSINYKEAISQGFNVTFKFEPDMEGFYCNEQSKCTKVDLRNMKIDSNGIGRINGLTVGRNPGCWGVCNYKIPGKSKLKPLQKYDNNNIKLIIIVCIIAIIFSLLIFLYIKKIIH